MKEKDSPYSQETQTPARKTCNLYIKGIYQIETEKYAPNHGKVNSE